MVNMPIRVGLNPLLGLDPPGKRLHMSSMKLLTKVTIQSDLTPGSSRRRPEFLPKFQLHGPVARRMLVDLAREPPYLL
jgi:hypothetical protein